jgi:NAD-dependent DNA ligase
MNLTPEEMLVQAHRYLYYVLGVPIISDYDYDMLERKLPSDSSVRQSVGSDRASDYTGSVIEIAQGLLGK